jgi:hypothetical protein
VARDPPGFGIRSAFGRADTSLEDRIDTKGNGQNAMGRENDDTIRLLRSLAHHIHRKIPADEALKTCFEAEGRGGRHRRWREAGTVLAEDGFVPALLAGGLIGGETAAVLAVVADNADHRTLSAAIGALADYQETA